MHHTASKLSLGLTGPCGEKIIYCQAIYDVYGEVVLFCLVCYASLKLPHAIYLSPWASECDIGLAQFLFLRLTVHISVLLFTV